MKLKGEMKLRQGEENRKVIVFCAFADTAAYLYEALEAWIRKTLGLHIALVSGGFPGRRQCRSAVARPGLYFRFIRSE